MVIPGEVLIGKGSKEPPGGAENTLHLDLGDGHKGTDRQTDRQIGFTERTLKMSTIIVLYWREPRKCRRSRGGWPERRGVEAIGKKS